MIIRRVRIVDALAAIGAFSLPPQIAGQAQPAELIDAARVQLSANHLDSAAALLRAALDPGAHADPIEQKDALVWSGIVEFLRGDDSLARAAFARALDLDTALDVKGLERISPQLAQLFQETKRVAVRRGFVYLAENVDEPPRRLAGPPVQYPPSLLRQPSHPAGFVRVTAIVDTAGRVEPPSVEVLSAPDSALMAPVRQMMLATQFSPGRVKGTTVRVMIQLAVDVHPPRLSATELVGTARRQLAAGRPDSARELLTIALDSDLTHPTEGERAYALLVRGLAEAQVGRDSASQAALGAGLALYHSLISRGVDLAPFLRRFADSVRLGGGHHAATSPGATMPAPSAVGTVDEQPVLTSHPPIRYPPEMQTLRVAGTVTVEATLDATGHIESASVKVMESPNHAFDAEALRAVRGSVYRPARSHGQAVRSVIRQAITFAGY